MSLSELASLLILRLSSLLSVSVRLPRSIDGFNGPPPWFLKASEIWGERKMPVGTGEMDTERPPPPRCYSPTPLPTGTFHFPQVSLALKNQDGGPLNSAIDRDNHTPDNHGKI